MNTHSPQRTEAELRAERLAKSLRDNLKRRKVQARERKNAPGTEEQTIPASTTSDDSQ